jgi:hypothetical protein
VSTFIQNDAGLMGYVHTPVGAPKFPMSTRRLHSIRARGVPQFETVWSSGASSVVNLVWLRSMHACSRPLVVLFLLHRQAYTLRALHILFFQQDLSCAAQNFCKPHMFPDGSGGFYDSCVASKSCCGTGDTLCPCAAAELTAPGEVEAAEAA